MSWEHMAIAWLLCGLVASSWAFHVLFREVAKLSGLRDVDAGHFRRCINQLNDDLHALKPSQEAESKKELESELAELREFKARKIARNVDGSEYTFSAIAPTIEAYLGQNDGEGSNRECHVRFLLDDGSGCVVDFETAREVAHEILKKVDAALFQPVPPPRVKKPRKPRAPKVQTEEKPPLSSSEFDPLFNAKQERHVDLVDGVSAQTELEAAIIGAAS